MTLNQNYFQIPTTLPNKISTQQKTATPLAFINLQHLHSRSLCDYTPISDVSINNSSKVTFNISLIENNRFVEYFLQLLSAALTEKILAMKQEFQIFKPSRDFYLLKTNNRSTKRRCKICSQLTRKTSEQRHWHRPGVFVSFEHISHFVLVFLLLTLNMKLPTENQFQPSAVFHIETSHLIFYLLG